MNPRHMRQIVLLICFACALLGGLIVENSVSARADSRPMQQESPLSPLDRAEGVALALDGKAPVAASTPTSTSQTGLVRVLFVLASVVVVIGLAMWRQR